MVEGIERGLADMKAGRLVPHDEAMDRLEATIVAAGLGNVETDGSTAPYPDAAVEELTGCIAYIAERDPSVTHTVPAAVRAAANGLGSGATGRRGRVADTYREDARTFPVYPRVYV